MKNLLLAFAMICTCQARISVMYAHDKLSDMVAEQCLNEMYPKAKRVDIHESDEPCIIFCVLKKFGIMSPSGVINLEIFRKAFDRDNSSTGKQLYKQLGEPCEYFAPILVRKRVQIAHQLDQRSTMNDFGSTCLESAEAIQHKQDVCKKAKVFNDCTHLYRILLK